VPIGILSDRYSKCLLIKIGGVLTLLTTILSALLFSWIGEDRRLGQHGDMLETKFWALVVIMGCWGAIEGIINGPLFALFADSTP
jgi:MFS family permease